MAARVKQRIQALQREADRLARESRTVLGDMRRLQVERDLATERLTVAEAAVKQATADLEAINERLSALEQERVDTLPDLQARFVEMYKHGRGGYARMLMGVRDLRAFGRATRAVASLAHMNQQRIERHRRMLEALRAERTRAEETTRELQARHADARSARTAAARAMQARAALLDALDRRRDLNAQLAGELLVAQQQLELAVQRVASGEPPEHVMVPLAPFRGALEWPVIGKLVGRFGHSNRMSSAGVRNGIELAAPAGTSVRAVHPGTVGFADSFTGYGTLVILDHGANQYTLYGYLAEAFVTRGQRVNAGDELGRVGTAPVGDSALYYEMRIDGRSVDPLQWLKRR
jgi:septal ring factor EnvC (AmiA/AmiB activator)